MRTTLALSLVLVAGCSGAGYSDLFGPGDVDAASSDGLSRGDAPGSSSASLEAGANAPPHQDSGASPPPSSPEAGSSPPPSAQDAGGGAPAPSSNACPQTADYSYEFSDIGAEMPMCGPNHGGPCADPVATCCYYDTATRTYTCLPWLDGG